AAASRSIINLIVVGYAAAAYPDHDDSPTPSGGRRGVVVMYQIVLDGHIGAAAHIVVEVNPIRRKAIEFIAVNYCVAGLGVYGITKTSADAATTAKSSAADFVVEKFDAGNLTDKQPMNIGAVSDLIVLEPNIIVSQSYVFSFCH